MTVTPIRIDMGPPPTWLDTVRAAAHYAVRSGGAVTFLGELCIDTAHDGTPVWSEDPVAVFWQERPPQPDHSPYFGLVRRSGGLMICDARSVATGTWAGLLNLRTSTVLFSRFRHDFRKDDDGAFVDGGRDYARIGAYTDHHRVVDLQVVGPKMEIARVVAVP